MPRSNKLMLQNLQKAINHTFDVGLLVDKVQWYSEQQQRAITYYKIKITVPKKDRVKNIKYVELFSTSSQIQAILFLRDYWYELNGWEVPTDNQMWEEIKRKRKESNADSLHNGLQ